MGIRPLSTLSPYAGKRIALLDFLRTVALVRVFVRHTLGLEALTWLTSMPIMFFVAGALFYRSMSNRSGPTVVKDRFIRILPPLWTYVAALVVVFAMNSALTLSASDVIGVDGRPEQIGLMRVLVLFLPMLSLSPPVGPGTPDQDLFWTWDALWYIHMHLLFALIGPLLVIAYRRWKTQMLVVMTVLCLLALVASGGTDIAFLFLLFYVAGFTFTDKTLDTVSRSTTVTACAVGFALGFAFIPLGPTLAVNQWGPSLLLLGIGWLALALLTRNFIERLSKIAVVAAFIEFASRRAMTIYLWSLLGIYVSRLLVPPEGDLLQLVATGVASLAIASVVTFAACVVVGPIEDIAARRPVEFFPGIRHLEVLRSGTEHHPARPDGARGL